MKGFWKKYGLPPVILHKIHRLHEILHVFMGFSMKSTTNKNIQKPSRNSGLRLRHDGGIAAPPVARRLRSSSQDWPGNSSPASGGYGGTWWILIQMEVWWCKKLMVSMVPSGYDCSPWKIPEINGGFWENHLFLWAIYTMVDLDQPRKSHEDSFIAKHDFLQPKIRWRSIFLDS